MIKALLTIDAPVFYRAPDGRVYTQSVATYDDYWIIPRQSFVQLIVVTRLRNIDRPDDTWRLADGEGVIFRSVPFYRGPFQYLLVSREIRVALKSALEECDVLLCNGPGTLSAVAINIANDLKKLYALDVLSDPYDVFAPGAMKHPLRPVFRWWFPRQLQKQCAGACAISYVTKQALQERYPPSSQALSIGVSDVHIPDAAIVSAPRPLHQKARTLNVIFIGTLAQLYKAPDVLIDAVAVCVREGLDIKLTLLGDGKHRAELEAQAARLRLGERISFVGILPAGNAVRHQLDQADLFVMPSYQEGLPKAMVEAMARALPVIGSTVGGIPELLPPEDMVPPGDVNALARKIREVVTDPERMARMSARNLEKAKEFKYEVLREQRMEFYRYVHNKTEQWLGQQK
ncbi:MAG: glycosyltransferase family 4 protein [Stigonema ocellatum SAG 48.90 = DSM 106950]|nr:glycosyltransferase family 4 protein [Stigonema ocellatum SAG 48.90 = DSM 106950]